MPNIRVEIRVRRSSTPGVLRCENNRVTVGTRTYEFDRVHTTTRQEELFKMSVKPLVDGFVGGADCSVIAYGQTGSGKTYTIGICPASREGMVQCTLKYIFSMGFSPTCSFIEIYNEEIIDLLSDERIPLNLRAVPFPQERACIVGQKEEAPRSLEEAMEVLERGSCNRTTKCTKMNSTSSRSHAVFSLHLGCNTFSFVDLAGSERLKRTKCQGDRAKESIAINTGLLALGNVITALFSGKKHIPFRDSKLTRILEPCLSSKLLFIACVSPLQADLNETANTLKYAGRAARISIEDKASKGGCIVDKNRAEIVRLEREISKLKEENNRLRSKIYSGLKSEDIKRHPYVKNLEDEVRNLRAQLAEYHNQKDYNERVESYDNIIPTPIDIPVIKKDEPIALKEDATVFPKKRLVSFDLQSRPKKSFFTPRRELSCITPILLASLSLATTASCASDNNEYIACLSDGLVVCIKERPTPLFEDHTAITSIISCDRFGLIYSSGSLLKLFSYANRSIPLLACSAPITTLAYRNNSVYIGHSDGALSVYDLAANSTLLSEKLHNGAIFSIAFSDNYVFTGSRDHSIRYSRIDDSNYKSVEIFRDAFLSPPHYDSVSTLMNYKNHIISLSRDCSIKTWRGIEPFKSIPGAHSSWIKSGAVAESCWISGCKEGELRCWDFVDDSVRCVGKADVGSPIERITSVGNTLWVASRREVYQYAIR